MSGAPIGELIKVEINGEERSYHILPRVFSSKTMEALGRVYKHEARQVLMENLKTAAEIRKTDPAVYQDFAKEITKQASSRVFVGYEQSIEALSTREGMIVALQNNCPECESRVQAEELLDSADNIMDIMAKLISAGTEALEAAKNSFSPEMTEGESEERKTEEVPG